MDLFNKHWPRRAQDHKPNTTYSCAHKKVFHISTLSRLDGYFKFVNSNGITTTIGNETIIQCSARFIGHESYLQIEDEIGNVIFGTCGIPKLNSTKVFNSATYEQVGRIVFTISICYVHI